MLLAALGIFFLVALGGIYLAGFHLSKDRRLAPLARAHGVLAIGGIGLLVAAIAAGHRSALALVACGLYGVIAGLGLWMRSISVRGESVSPALIAMHAGLAVIAGVLLFTAYATSQ